MPGLFNSALELMKGPPIYLDQPQAEAVLDQFQETAIFRQHTLSAVSIMNNHFPMVVQVLHDPNPTRLLGDFKAYDSRRLNRQFGEPTSETWWTTNGSKRIIRTDQHLADAIHYVLYKQFQPLVTWCPELGRIV